MHPYYVRRKKYYFKIERQRRKRRQVLLTILVASISISLFLGIRGLRGSSFLHIEPEDKAEKSAIASLNNKPGKEKPKGKKSEKEKQPQVNLPKLAIVIDDVGFVQTHIAEFQNIKIPLTFSVMPHARHGKANAELFHAQGQEIILHLPMENSPSQSSIPGEVTTKMSDEQIVAALDEDLALVPYAKGMNNHEGMSATADKRVVSAVLNHAKNRGLFFLDSLTTSKSLVCQVQGEIGMPKRVNDRFIDREESIEYAKAQLQWLGDLAKKKGVAIGIGHIQGANTTKAIQEMAPVLQSQGIQFVFLSQIPGNR